MSAYASSTTEKNAVQKPQRATFWHTKKFRLLVAAILLVLVLLGGGMYWLLTPRIKPLALPHVPAHLTWADIGLEHWQDYQQPLPEHPLDNTALPAKPQVNKNLALLQDAAGQALIQQGQNNLGVEYMKAAVLAVPDNLRYANDLRLAWRDHQQYKEEEAFFSALNQKYPTINTQIALALSYVDEMRSCPNPPDGLVCQAQFSSRSISELSEILTNHPYNIVARYARGLNHLYWPTLMGHLSQSQEDLQFSVVLTQIQGAIGPSFLPQAYTALGDVFAKGGKVDVAQNVWENGLKVAPSSTMLQQRLAIAKESLVSEEENHLRGLGVYVDTDVAIFWQKGR
ncbi:hypothetical protein [Ktedonobacter robiniae]|uniref:Uncharacterized protein n=1 Tax=Ktedonobacter robiniae TaxID=2778365 RepID=A0ABQ3V4X1_9CHLR|nr:hypothetical protein [Ktedonobacter robiniae]GHO60001.1 hypothetical protein KSB_84760 [Ktedonobacter robiniae]